MVLLEHMYLRELPARLFVFCVFLFLLFFFCIFFCSPESCCWRDFLKTQRRDCIFVLLFFYFIIFSTSIIRKKLFTAMYTPNRYQTIAVRNECEFQDSAKNPGFRISRSLRNYLRHLQYQTITTRTNVDSRIPLKNPSFHLIRSLWKYLHCL
jgi:hypothetical protein